MSTTAALTVFAQDAASTTWLRSGGPVHVVRRMDDDLQRTAGSFLVLALASRLPEIAEFITAANHRHRLKGLLVLLDNAAMAAWLPQMLDRANLRTLRNCLSHNGAVVPRRVVEAWRAGAQDDLLADVTATNETLFALTCAMDRLEVPMASIPALKRLSPAQRQHFEVAADGNYVYWPDGDVHLDVDAIRLVVDPGYRATALVARAKHLLDFGQRVRAVRMTHGVAPAGVHGVSDRQLRRIESGEFFPRVETLTKLAEAHGLGLSDYLHEIANVATSN